MELHPSRKNWLMVATLLTNFLFTEADGLPMRRCEELFRAQPTWTEALAEWSRGPGESRWPALLRQWETDGHNSTDLELVSKHIRSGELMESEGRAIIERGSMDPVQTLLERDFITRAEYQSIERAFQQVVVDEPLGIADRVPTLKAEGGPARRDFLLVQEFRGIFSETDREIVALDTNSMRKLASLQFSFLGYRRLVIGHTFALYYERSQRYVDLLLSDLLRRYPSVTEVSFEIPAIDFQALQNATGPGGRDQDIILGSRAYKIAKQFGFKNFKLVRESEGAGYEAAQILAERAPMIP